jgi:hypothetical protein
MIVEVTTHDRAYAGFRQSDGIKAESIITSQLS